MNERKEELSLEMVEEAAKEVGLEVNSSDSGLSIWGDPGVLADYNRRQNKLSLGRHVHANRIRPLVRFLVAIDCRLHGVLFKEVGETIAEVTDEDQARELTEWAVKVAGELGISSETVLMSRKIAIDLIREYG